MTRGNNMKLIPALVLGLFSSYVSASGFQLTEQNASGLGNAYAGQGAVTENASTIFFNPAGMTQLKDREISGGLTAVKTSFKFTNQASNVAQFGTAGNGGDGGTLGLIPNGYLSWALSKDLYVGVGVGAPFGLKTEYDNPWIGAAQSTMFDLKTYNINPSIAYRVNDKVSLGLGVNYQRLDAEYKRQAGIFDTAHSGVPLTTSAVDLKLNGDTWGWNVGGLLTLSPATKIGVSYRSEMKYSLTGNIGISSTSAAVAAGASNVKADLTLPGTFNLSVAQELSDRWQMMGDITWTGWSSIPKLDIVRSSGAGSGLIAQTLDTNFRDTWRVGLGATYKLNDAWKLKFGIAYDQTPVKGADTRLTSLPDNNRTWFSTGAQWKLAKEQSLDVGIAYLYLKDAQINNNQGTVPSATLPMRGLVNGSYSDSAWILGAQYSLAF